MSERDRIPEADIQRLLDTTSIGAVVARYVELDRKQFGCCPFHQEKSPSFHVRHRVEGKIGGRFKCFGCGESGDVISFVMAMERITFAKAYERLRGDLRPTKREHRSNPQREAKPDAEKLACAIALWESAVPIAGTPAETYLRARGIHATLDDADLRFNAAVSATAYTPSKSAKHPAMVAAIRNAGGEQIGTHVTYLRADGLAKAEIDPARKIYGKQDRGMIVLAPLTERMVLGEGIESSLSASDLTGRGSIAAVCSGNMRKLQPLDGVNDWLIAYDRDPNNVGRNAGEAFANKAISAGKIARAFAPPADVRDWNDAAQRRA